MPPRVLFLGRNDWANVSHRVARGMNAAAGEQVARVLVLEPHPFGYVEDMVLTRATSSGWREIGRAADWLISTGDGDYPVFGELVKMLRREHGQRLGTCHVGSAYRSAATRYNEIDREMGFVRRFIGGDLFRFAIDDPTAVPYFAPPDEVVQMAVSGERVRIGHSPTSREKKGTSAILEVLEDISTGPLGPQVEVDVIEGVTYTEAAWRRARCHVFVDQLNPEIGGFGASSVEALAAGCAVLADVHNVHPNVARFYPAPPIINVRNPGELLRDLALLVRDRGELARRRLRGYEWACNWATPDAVGAYWLSHLAEPTRRAA